MRVQVLSVTPPCLLKPLPCQLIRADAWFAERAGFKEGNLLMPVLPTGSVFNQYPSLSIPPSQNPVTPTTPTEPLVWETNNISIKKLKLGSVGKWLNSFSPSRIIFFHADTWEDSLQLCAWFFLGLVFERPCLSSWQPFQLCNTNIETPNYKCHHYYGLLWDIVD